MKKKLFACLIVAAFSGLTGFADTEQTVTIDGTTENKFVKELVFSGDQVTLIFEDGLSTTTDIEAVNIAFGYTPTTINKIEISDCKYDGYIYSVDGKRSAVSDRKLGKGVYIRNGKKFTVK